MRSRSPRQYYTQEFRVAETASRTLTHVGSTAKHCLERRNFSYHLGPRILQFQDLSTFLSLSSDPPRDKETGAKTLQSSSYATASPPLQGSHNLIAKKSRPSCYPNTKKGPFVV
ncbi:hypothetical protein AVEN_96336-1 [Araneus ventricosus]|uniref:Uncharacterized protein n=1 Tax=Araneus ventricosus TaxID=182803 RepID=A0A4Y2V1K2_ARAVE|nr:hypothetical protein AVEN_96336-1 [Araneus ventricosus]